MERFHQLSSKPETTFEKAPQEDKVTKPGVVPSAGSERSHFAVWSQNLNKKREENQRSQRWKHVDYNDMNECLMHIFSLKLWKG